MTHRLAIASIYRDEARYLAEWVAYHRLVKFDHAYLLSNDVPGSEEDSAARAVLAPYIAQGFVTLAEHDDTSTAWQRRGWDKILDAWGPACEWLLLTDVDQFLFPVQEDSVLPRLKAFHKTGAGVVTINLCTFGDSNLDNPPALQTESFVWRAELSYPANFSSNYLVRPACMDRSTPEAYNSTRPGTRVVDTHGRPVASAGVGKVKHRGPLDVWRLNHYSIRSRADWACKVRRGWYDESLWPDPNHTLAEHKLKMLNKNDVFDDSMQKFVPRLKRELGL